MSIPESELKARCGIIDFPNFRLLELDRLCKMLIVNRATATRICNTLSIPILQIGYRSYINESTLEQVLYGVTRIGSPGFAAPGSEYKRKGKKEIPAEFTPELSAQVKDRRNMTEMLAAKAKRPSELERFARAIAGLEIKKRISRANEPKTKIPSGPDSP